MVDGKFDFWYEGTSQTSNGYGSATMRFCDHTGSTKTHSREELALGTTLPNIHVPTARFYSRTSVTSVAGSTNYVRLQQKIENGNTLAGKIVTVSFFGKADAAKTLGVTLSQGFGVGGSGTTYILPDSVSTISLTSTWQYYSVVFTIPSLSYKTVVYDSSHVLYLNFWFDAGSSVSINTLGLGMPQQSGTFDIACVQLEEGSVATPFEELPAEVALSSVMRYFQQIVLATDAPISYAPANIAKTGLYPVPVVMRALPTATFSTQTGGIAKTNSGTSKATSTSLTINTYTHRHFDIRAAFASYTYAAGDFLYLSCTLNLDARL